MTTEAARRGWPRGAGIRRPGTSPEEKAARPARGGADREWIEEQEESG